MSDETCKHGVNLQHDAWEFTSIAVKSCPFCKIEQLEQQLVQYVDAVELKGIVLSPYDFDYDGVLPIEFVDKRVRIMVLLDE